MDKPKKIGLLTSGGDAPGMNAAIRAVVRTAHYNDIGVIGIKRGYDGLLAGDIREMGPRSVSDILHRGGTILNTARCPEMTTDAGCDKAALLCKALALDALVVIGGDGSLKGALALSERGINVVGIPGTIDLDMDFTDYSIGFDTAVNTAVDAISKIRDTSSSHERCSVVEVMGRNAAHIALWCGVAGGAEVVLISDAPDNSVEMVINQVLLNRSKGKQHNLIIVAESIGGSEQLAKEIERVTGIETRATILGYLQRGGAPTAVDRIHASVMGFTAVELLTRGEYNRVVLYKDGRYSHMDIKEALAVSRPFDRTLYNVMKTLAV